MYLINVQYCILFADKMNNEQKQMDLLILQRMKTRLILFAYDVIQGWSAAKKFQWLNPFAELFRV